MTAEGTDFTIYREAMIFLATAAVLVPIGQRFKLSPILGFLIAGAVLGPHGLGALKGFIPSLEWVTVSEERGLGAMAELGVVFLLFIIGLELSFKRLLTMRRLVFGLGTLQVSISAVIIGAIAALYGAGAGAAVLIGLSLALSSTAVVIEVLSRGGRLSSSTGRTSFAILLLQDLAVVPLLFLVNILGPESEGNLLVGLAQAFGQAVLVIGMIALVGTALLRPMFRSVAAAGSTELFVAAALFVAVGSGLVTAAAGLSMALGAFVAGLLLAETEYHRAIEATIEPFKGLLLGVFFFSVGMSLDVAYLWNNPLPIVLGLLGLIAIKSGVLVVLLRLFRVPWPATIETSALLGPGGEFAFIVIGLAVAKKIVEPGMGEVVLALTSFSMAMVPALDYVARRWSHDVTAKKQSADPALSVPPPQEHVDAIVIGCGRVGRAGVGDAYPPQGEAHHRREGSRCRDARPRGRFPGLLRRRQKSAVPETLRHGRGQGRRHYHQQAFGRHRHRHRLARLAQRHPHRRPCARCRARAATLQTERIGRRAGDHRGEPAALRGDAGRARRADGSRHRLDPREAR